MYTTACLSKCKQRIKSLRISFSPVVALSYFCLNIVISNWLISYMILQQETILLICCQSDTWCKEDGWNDSNLFLLMLSIDLSISLTLYEPRQANLCLRAFRHDQFQLRMPSHSEGPGIWFSVWRFLLIQCLYERAAKVLARPNSLDAVHIR